METAYTYLGLSGMLTIIMWMPYIVMRLFVWGPAKFITNYPEGFPASQPEPPLWAQRSQRAHLNMVETMPAFIAVVVAAGFLVGNEAGTTVGHWAAIFFFTRIVHYIVYTLGIPFVRTPVYLVSWAAVLMIGSTFLL